MRGLSRLPRILLPCVCLSFPACLLTTVLLLLLQFIRSASGSAQRYHKVKFFERQKVSRKLESARKKLDAIETAKHRSSSSKKQKRDAKSDDSSVAGNEASIRAEIAALEDDLTVR